MKFRIIYKHARVLGIGCLLAASAWAGGDSSGGGPSILCYNPLTGRPRSAELLDLYEGRVRPEENLHIPNPRTSTDVQLTRAFKRLEAANWFLASDVEEALTHIEAKLKYLKRGSVMRVGSDLGEAHAPIVPDSKNCELVYAAYYDSDGNVTLSEDVWRLLNDTNRAALFMHEALYSVARTIGQQSNSLTTRELNAYLFSTQPDLSVVKNDVESMTWKKFVEVNALQNSDFGTNVLANPVLVKEYANSATFAVSPAISGTGAELILRGYNEDGERTINVEKDLYRKDAPFSSFEEPTRGARLLMAEFTSFDDNAIFEVTLKYGDQTLTQVKFKPQTYHTAYAGDEAYARGSVIVPVYLERILKAPTRLPN